MTALRRVVFWLHLLTGAAAGLVILVMTVTGVLLTFEPQIVEFSERHLRSVPVPSGDAKRLPLDDLVARVRATRGDANPTSVMLRPEPGSVVRVAFDRDDVVGINPYTGDLLSGRSKTHDVMHVIEEWHRWLGARETRRWATGLTNIAFFFLALSGLSLWWPRAWSRAAVRAVTIFDGRLSGRARDFNWHNTTGFWCAAVIVVLTLTGVVMSYQWANDLLYTMTGNTPPPPPGAPRPEASRPREGERRRSGPTESLEALAVRAQAQQPGWNRIMLRLPQRPGGPLTVFIAQEVPWGPIQRSQLTLDSATGNVSRWEPYATANAGRKLRTWVRYLHTGEVFGVPGQLVAGLASAGGVLLVYTGYALAWRRLRAWRARSRIAAPVSVAVNAVPGADVPVDATR